MILNNIEITMDVNLAMVQKVLRLRLSRLQHIEDKMIKAKPDERLTLNCILWLEDMNQIERLIHQTREFLETREAGNLP